MGSMLIATVLSCLALAAVAGFCGFLYAGRRATEASADRESERIATQEAVAVAVGTAVEQAVADVRDQAANERDAAVKYLRSG